MLETREDFGLHLGVTHNINTNRFSGIGEVQVDIMQRRQGVPKQGGNSRGPYRSPRYLEQNVWENLSSQQKDAFKRFSSAVRGTEAVSLTKLKPLLALPFLFDTQTGTASYATVRFYELLVSLSLCAVSLPDHISKIKMALDRLPSDPPVDDNLMDEAANADVEAHQAEIDTAKKEILEALDHMDIFSLAVTQGKLKTE